MAKREPDGRATREPVVVPAPAARAYFAYKSWALALALMLITFVAYTPVWHAGFIWDDVLMTNNPMVKASDGLHRSWFTTEPLDYYPMTWSLWWLEWRWWGNSATGYHVVNVLLHAANAVLLWIILLRLKVPGAWLAGLVFAIHPVNVATAAWISEQKNTLSMLFYAATVLLYLKFDEEGRWRWYGLSLAAFLLALLSKTAVVMLPVVLLGCIWWRRGGLRGKDVMRSMPFFACSLILGLVTVWFQYYRAMGGTTTRTDGFLSRLVAAGWVPWFYLYEVFLPFNLTAIYPQWHMDASRWISYIPGMALVGCFALFWWKRNAWGRPVLFGLGYFVVTLFPVLGFFDQGFYQYSLVADHWQYYSIVGAIALAAAGGVAICRRIGTRGQYVGVLASVGVLVTLGVATWTRANVYKDEKTLWRDNVAKFPNVWAAHYNLGRGLSQAGKINEAIVHYEQALRLKPDYAKAHYNLGNVLEQTGKVTEAIAQYEQALRLNPDYAEAHNNLGGVLLGIGRVREAIEHYEQALRIKPDSAASHCNLANALSLAGNVEDAIRHYEQALRIKPDYAEAHSNLGLALWQTGKVQEAIGHYEQALRIRPDFAEAHYNLGNVLVQAGRVQDGIGHYEQALRIKPDYAEAHNNLGAALEQAGRLQDAIGYYEQALRIKPDYAEAKTNLANAQATRQREVPNRR